MAFKPEDFDVSKLGNTEAARKLAAALQEVQEATEQVKKKKSPKRTTKAGQLYPEDLANLSESARRQVEAAMAKKEPESKVAPVDTLAESPLSAKRRTNGKKTPVSQKSPSFASIFKKSFTSTLRSSHPTLFKIIDAARGKKNEDPEEQEHIQATAKQRMSEEISNTNKLLASVLSEQTLMTDYLKSIDKKLKEVFDELSEKLDAIKTPTTPGTGGPGPAATRAGGGPGITATGPAPPAYTGLGSISAKYESGGRGVSTISSGMLAAGVADPGGVSYGTHQLASKTGTMTRFLESPEGRPYAAQFAGLEPGSREFNTIYQQIAASDPEGFARAQQAFITRTHYSPVAQTAQQVGFNVEDPKIQETLYSMGVQHGRASDIVRSAGDPTGKSTDEQVKMLYAARRKYVTGLGMPQLLPRYEREESDVLNLKPASQIPSTPPAVGREDLNTATNIPNSPPSPATPLPPIPPTTGATALSASAKREKGLQGLLANSGLSGQTITITDPSPTNNFVGENYPTPRHDPNDPGKLEPRNSAVRYSELFGIW